MHADGLLVTEKMFRDRIRQWGMNNKNRRSATSPRCKALQPANNRDKGPGPGSQHTKTHRSSTQPALLHHENLHNVLRTPNEILVLQRTLKSVLDWQEHIEICQVSRKKVTEDEHSLLNSLETIANSLHLLQAPCMCGKVTQLLQRESEALQSHIIARCTPLAVFRSIDLLIYLARRRKYSAWHYHTLRFLIKIAAAILPSSHPSLMLLRLLFEEPTAAQLAMVYEIGSRIMQRFHGGAEADIFRAEFLTAVLHSGLGATFRYFAESLCTSSSDTNDAKNLLRIAVVYFSMHRYDECETLVRKSLMHLKVEGKENSADSTMFYLLSALQNNREDFVGEEKSLRRCLAIKLIGDRRSCHGSQLEMDVLRTIADLDNLYRHHGLGEQRHALRLEFPGAFRT